MDQEKIGCFLKKLRKEKELTQEEVAEVFGVSRRTVSRWETGENMPDLSILVEIADYYNVELREIFNGERKDDKMNNELKETMKQAAEYNNIEKKRASKIILIYLIVGITSLIINQIFVIFDISGTFFTGFVKGATAGLTLCSLIFAILFITGRLTEIKENKNRILNK